MKKSSKKLLNILLWLAEGIIVGFGAIMPGISGGTLCVSFGMYQPLIHLLSHPKENIRRYGVMLGIFLLGVVFGFVGLSGLAGWLMALNSHAVICVFIGLILGTFPALWTDAGEKGRTKSSYFSLLLGFIFMLGFLLLFKMQSTMTIAADAPGFFFCGILWGLSFIVPGLSSSTLLIFFGLYQPMLDGIAGMDWTVLLPLAAGIAACVILLTKAVNVAFKKYYASISHGIIGLVAATVLMIVPDWQTSGLSLLYNLLYILCGGLASYGLTRLCNRLKH